MLEVTNTIHNSGFRMTFANGWTISVQFGGGNFCENRTYGDVALKATVSSANAEIAIWDEKDRWFNFENDQVKGWVTPNEVAEWIQKVSKFEPA